MELGTVKVFVFERGAEHRAAVAAGGDGVLAESGIVGMYEVHVRRGRNVAEKFASQIGERVPAHVGDFHSFLRGEALHLAVENVHALHVALLGTAAHQLHADADAEYWLPQAADQSLQAFGPEARHRCCGIADARQDDLVRVSDGIRIGRERIFYTQPGQSVGHGLDIARVVVYNGYHRSPLDEGKARASLEKELSNSVNSTCDNIWSQLEKNLDRLVEGKIDLVIRELTEMEKVIMSLASTQRGLSDSLRTELQTLNKTFTGKIASAVFGEERSEEYLAKINTVSREPGVCTLIVEENEGGIGEDFRTQMSGLISEEIRFVTTNEDKAQFVSDVLDGLVSKDNIGCENEDETVIIRTDEKDIKLFHKLRLLEQLAPYKIGG